MQGTNVTYSRFSIIYGFFGDYLNLKVITDDNGKSRGCGFVSFEEHKAAQKVSNTI